ncbi:MAG: UDP-N-acetylmuramoyl-L-alanine--D-glutamate ligase, partial [Alphaproteobacteria bacterium]|nr:UDP-N-acetylmuramoyl-L-alanine--D-glutamate ligase [Alphaproteobacteria bacterium]
MQGRKIAVFGLARSGIAAARVLAESGARVVAWDDSPKSRAAAAEAGVLLSDVLDGGLDGASALVLSPGVALTHPAPHPAVTRARESGVSVIGDVELFARAKGEAGLVGVTGTNGKSTTTALIGHILATAGRRVAVGGNIGTPVFDLPDLGADGVYVLELSSFQIDLCEAVDCDVAVLLNFSPDHLDRHGDMDGYVAVKRRLFAMQRAGRVAVIGCDDRWSRETCERLVSAGRHRVMRISAA